MCLTIPATRDHAGGKFYQSFELRRNFPRTLHDRNVQVCECPGNIRSSRHCADTIGDKAKWPLEELHMLAKCGFDQIFIKRIYNRHGCLLFRKFAFTYNDLDDWIEQRKNGVSVEELTSRKKLPEGMTPWDMFRD